MKDTQSSSLSDLNTLVREGTSMGWESLLNTMKIVSQKVQRQTKKCYFVKISKHVNL